jgi:DNA-binding beta-propeller fold protein YncE
MVAFALLAPAGASAVPPRFGGLTHLGCVSNESSGACSTGHALDDDGYPPVVLSPDGRNAYAGEDDGSGAVAVFARDSGPGVMSQLPGTAGCVSEDGTGGQCADGIALVGGFAPVVSPDGKNVYVTANQSNSVTAFARDPATGTLTQLPGQSACVSDDGTGGACVHGRALNDTRGIAVSPDGQNVYVAASVSSSLTVFSRDAGTGALTQLGGADGCVLESGGGMSTCADGAGLTSARGVTVSADGLNVYVASDSGNAIAIFTRDPVTGAVHQLPGTAGCISATGNSGECEPLPFLNGPRQVTLSPDGRNAYATIGGSNGGVAVFTRDAGTGALSLLPGTAGCVTQDGSGGACAQGVAVASGNGVGVSPDGRSVYLASIDPTSALTTFDRDPVTGALTQLPGTAGCATETGEGGACLAPPVFHAITSVAISADGSNLYALADGASAIHSFARELPPTCTDVSHAVLFGAPTVIPLTCSDPNGDPITRTIVAGPPNGKLAAVNPNGSVLYTPPPRFRGADSFTFRATDGSLSSSVAVAALTVTADTIRPRISRASVSPRVFAVRARAAARLKRATTFRYRLSEAARMVITIQRARPRRHGHPKRFARVGRLSQRGSRGNNKLRFNGKIRRTTVKPGSYRAILVATDPAGNRSKRRILSFRIVSAARH